MIMSSQAGDEWLSLSEAANLLGMHPATVRSWADRNEIPSRRTSGGHRRFRRTDVEARLREETQPEPAALLLIESVLGRIRFAFTDGTLNTFPWYQHFDVAARDGYRQLGRQLLDLLLRTFNDPNKEQLTHEIVELGHAYGRITRQSHIPVADAVRAFLYFRTLVDKGILQLVEVRGSHSQDIPWAESLYQIQAITNELLPALIEGALNQQNEVKES
jgi:excisionase family DNA binding protein